MDTHIPLSRWVVMFVAVLCAAFPTMAYHMPQQAHGGGVTLYWGITSAEEAEDQPGVAALTDASVKDQRHLVVALYEDKSGARINDARVTAKITRFGLVTVEEKTLRPLRVNGAVSYGNYFDMPPDRTHSIMVEIKRPNVAQAVNVKFKYRERE